MTSEAGKGIGIVPYAFAVVSIVLSSTAQIVLKQLMRDQVMSWRLIQQPYFYLGFGAYGLSAILWLKVLSRLPLVVAYPLVSLNFIFVALGGAAFLHERIGWPTFVGLALIMLGIAVITRN